VRRQTFLWNNAINFKWVSCFFCIDYQSRLRISLHNRRLRKTLHFHHNLVQYIFQRWLPILEISRPWRAHDHGNFGQKGGLVVELFAGAVILVLVFKAEANGKGGNQSSSIVLMAKSLTVSSSSSIRRTNRVAHDCCHLRRHRRTSREFDDTFPYAEVTPKTVSAMRLSIFW